MRCLYFVETYACSIDQPIYTYPLKAWNTCKGRTEEHERQRVQSRCDRATVWRRYSSLFLPAEKDPHDVLDSFLRPLLRAPEFPPSFLPFVLTARDGLPHPLYQYGAVRVIGRGLLVHSLFPMRIRFERQEWRKQVDLLTEEWLASLAIAWSFAVICCGSRLSSQS